MWLTQLCITTKGGKLPQSKSRASQFQLYIEIWEGPPAGYLQILIIHAWPH